MSVFSINMCISGIYNDYTIYDYMIRVKNESVLYLNLYANGHFHQTSNNFLFSDKEVCVLLTKIDDNSFA